jgi:hypothetical protein
MRIRHVPVLIALVIAVAALLGAAIAGPVGATPSRSTVCTNCHSGAASGTVTATPSTSTPAAGAAYTVAINIGLTASGNTGYHIASTDAAGTATTWTTVSSTIGSQTSWTANMTAPATAGTYYYKVWCAKGPNDATGMAKAALYSITVPAPIPTAAITSLTPNHAQTGASVVIAGTNLGSGGTVRFGTTVAATGAWSATAVTATVPAGLSPGAAGVTVTPTGGAASNALTYTVDAPPVPTDDIAPTTVATGVTEGRWYRRDVTIHLVATDDIGGSGVASITYSVDAGVPVTVGGAAADVVLSVGPDATAADGAIPVSDGPHTLTYYATDVAGNVETAQAQTVNVDTRKPSTRSPRGKKVRRYQWVTLDYEVRDAEPNGGKATVAIVIKNRSGSTVKTLRLGSKPVNKALKTSFRCTLRSGVYSFTVKATDLAGNTQASAATRALAVLPAS